MQPPKKQKKIKELPSSWRVIQENYQILDFLGEGSYGQVCKIQHRQTEQIFAVKCIDHCFKDLSIAKKTLREISILRQLSEVKNNIFTTKIHEIIIPGFKQRNPEEREEEEKTHTIKSKHKRTQSFNSIQRRKTQVESFTKTNTEDSKFKRHKSDDSLQEKVYSADDLGKIKTVFIIMDLVETDLKQVLNSVKTGTQLTEEHIKIVLYNSLCALNFLHSANIMHRDMKPANLLIDGNCAVRICDYGLSRVIPRRQSQGRSIYSQNTAKRNELTSNSTESVKSYRKQFTHHLHKTQPDRQRRQRQLSGRIISRWYRPPEVILTECEYGQAIDVWGLGCILAEMIHCSKPYVEQNQDKTQDVYVNQRHLFNGKSCFPISPCQKSIEQKDENTNIVSQNDQLVEINRFFGALSEQDTSFITEPTTVAYQESLQEKEANPDKFMWKFAKSSPDMIKILEGMLEYNPFFRSTASELLTNKFFDDIRIPGLEKASKTKIKLNFDDAQIYDYELNKWSYSKTQILNFYKSEIIKEKNILDKPNE